MNLLEDKGGGGGEREEGGRGRKKKRRRRRKRKRVSVEETVGRKWGVEGGSEVNLGGITKVETIIS